jgi:hypothetical protein
LAYALSIVALHRHWHPEFVQLAAAKPAQQSDFGHVAQDQFFALAQGKLLTRARLSGLRRKFRDVMLRDWRWGEAQKWGFRWFCLPFGVCVWRS